MVLIVCTPCSEIGVHLHVISTLKYSLLSPGRPRVALSAFLQIFQLLLSVSGVGIALTQE